MQVSNPNNIKIYNLSYGKSLPDFISDKKKRKLLKGDVSLRRRIELIQDFGMPTVSTSVQVSRDQQYIFATGTYKPMVRCYDVKDLSMKFERCLDCEAVAFDILSEDYSKVIFLLKDRHVELHTQQGKHYKVRIPKCGRDLAYHNGNCDLMLVGSGPEIYRINLDQGRFLKSYETHSPQLSTVEVNEDHHFVVAGGVDGHVECWDPRSKCRAGILDCSLGLVGFNLNEIPQVSALKFSSALQLAVGTSTGQVLLYDIRSNKPRIIKDHHYDLPIHSIAFNKPNDIVMSSDARSVKLWEEETGKAVTAVEMNSDINDMAIAEGTGLFFLANESPKIHTYFIPMLGPAPRWCAFLDNLTEELEENPEQEIYDDYKFLTTKEIDSLGLSNLVGTPLLRAYMHGYFVDMRLYQKARSIANPFAYKEYRKQKIAEKIEQARENRVHVDKLPKVNRKLAEKLRVRADAADVKQRKKKKDLKQQAVNLLEDSRFKAIFENPSFEVDEESEEFRSINHVFAAQMDGAHGKRSKKMEEHSLEENIDEDDDDKEFSSDEDQDETERSGRRWVQDAPKEENAKAKKKKQIKTSSTDGDRPEPRMFEMKSDAARSGKLFSTLHDLEAFAGEQARREQSLKSTATLEERIIAEEKGNVRSKVKLERRSGGGREATFEYTKETKQDIQSAADKKHREERRKLRRPANKLHPQKHKKSPYSRR